MNWNNRGDRIARMHERDQFDKVFMPLVYLVAIIGLIILAWQAIEWSEGKLHQRETLALGIMLFAMPVPFWIFRLGRGHYRSRLKD